jgi:short-subunit dehydrogenase
MVMAGTGREPGGRVVLLTGATGGLGPVMARALASAGARLALVALPDDGELEALALELGAQAVAADLSSLAALAPLVAEVEAGSGPVDVLVNNAGVEVLAAHARIPLEAIDGMVQVNLTAPLALARLVLPGMVRRGWGRIISTASVAGRAFPPYLAAYGATKAGLIAFTHSLNDELRGTGVRASAVVPGFVHDVGMFHRLFEPAAARVPTLLGTAHVSAVAAAVVRAARTGQAELLVNPGPARYTAPLARAFPGFASWLGRRIGVHAMLRAVADRWPGGDEEQPRGGP